MIALTSKEYTPSADNDDLSLEETDQKNTEYLKETLGEEELEEYLTNKVTLRWSRVFIVGIVVAIGLAAVTLLVCWIISYSVSIIFLYLPWIFIVEFGLLFIFGGCIGTVKQSFTIGAIKARLTRGERITGADTKIAIGSAYTYIVAGVLIGLASIIAWAVV